MDGLDARLFLPRAQPSLLSLQSFGLLPSPLLGETLAVGAAPPFLLLFALVTGRLGQR
jgi:hypothetical protein